MNALLQTLITSLSFAPNTDSECTVMANDKWPYNQDAGRKQELVDILHSPGQGFSLTSCDQLLSPYIGINRTIAQYDPKIIKYLAPCL